MIKIVRTIGAVGTTKNGENYEDGGYPETNLTQVLYI